MTETHPAALDGLRRLSDELSDGLALVQDGAIVWANARLAEWAGRPAAALLGLAPEALLEAGAPPLADGAETCLAGGPGRRVPVRARHVCGAGDREGAWLFHDVSRATDLEAEVLSLGRALRDANVQLDVLRARVKRQRTELDEVLTIVSHELRTPVTVVSGYARLLLSESVGPLNDQQRGFLDESMRSCRRLNGFIANLLTDSRDAVLDAPLQVHEAAVDGTLRGALNSMKPLLDEQGVVPLVRIDPETPAARFDPVRIEQVITNLVENALKYGRPGGAIEIHARPVREKGRSFVELSVQDDGPGVPEAERERVFERYVRVGERRNAGGLGLGLSICRRVVASHGGVMGITDSRAGGARFWFTLPAATHEPDARES